MNFYLRCGIYIAAGGLAGAAMGVGLSLDKTASQTPEITPTAVTAVAAAASIPQATIVGTPELVSFKTPPPTPRPTLATTPIPIPDPAPSREAAASPFVMARGRR